MKNNKSNIWCIEYSGVQVFMEVKTNVIKRNGEEVGFDLDKIINAIRAANREVDKLHQMNEYQVMAIADMIAYKVQETRHAVHVEDIQDMVETGIMEMRGYEVAQKYVRYRYKRELTRKSNTTDNGILALIEHLNEEVNQENSNKNPVINSTQRDYMAGEVSKDLSRRVLLPEEVVQAHGQGSSIFMIRTILHRRSITATLSTWKTCCRTVRSSARR